jgi:predicted dehydrogenase
VASDRLRYGVIGTGMMGIEHLKNLALVPGAALVAFADPHEESRHWARLVAGEAPRAYEDHRALLDDPRVDAVVIATPNHTHRALLEDAFATRKHLLVEKPLCTTPEDARWAAERAARHPGVVWTAMEYRYMPPVARLLDELRKGTIGRLRMLAVGSEAVRVYASGAMDVNHKDERYEGETPDILDNAYVIVDFANGARALLDLCMFAEGSRNQEEIAATGDLGKLECFVPESSVVIGQRQPLPRKVERFAVPVEEKLLAAGFHHGSTFYEHERFFAAVVHGAPVEVTAEDGLRAVEIGAAAEQSVREARPIALGRAT